MKINTKETCDYIDSYSKFRKAIRYEIPLVNIDYDKVWKSYAKRIVL